MSTDLETASAAPQDDDVADATAPSLDEQAPARPSETAQWVYLFLAVVIIALAFLMNAPGKEKVYLPGMRAPLPGLCVTKSTVGIDCPGCGLTRCFISLAHGQVERAWHFNPGGFLFFAVVVAQLPLRLVQIVRIRTGRDTLQWPIFTWILGAVGVCLVLQWAVKMWHQYMA